MFCILFLLWTTDGDDGQLVKKHPQMVVITSQVFNSLIWISPAVIKQSNFLLSGERLWP